MCRPHIIRHDKYICAVSAYQKTKKNVYSKFQNKEKSERKGVRERKKHQNGNIIIRFLVR